MMPDRVQLAWMAWNQINGVLAGQSRSNPWSGQSSQEGRTLTKAEASLHNVAAETLTRFIMGGIDPAPDPEVMQEHGHQGCNCPVCRAQCGGHGGFGGMLVVPPGGY